MDISPTLAKQEIDIIDRILDQQTYSNDLEKIELLLKQFEGKHFRSIQSEPALLLKRVKEILEKFKSEGVIHDFYINEKLLASRESLIVVDLSNCINKIKQYKSNLLIGVGNVDLQTKLKKDKLCKLDTSGKTFYFFLPDGTPKVMPLWTTRAESEHIYLIFKILYDHWTKFYEQAISKSEIGIQLDNLGWNATGDDIKNCIKNLRTSKIVPAGLSSYVKIKYITEQKGYVMTISYS